MLQIQKAVQVIFLLCTCLLSLCFLQSPSHSMPVKYFSQINAPWSNDKLVNQNSGMTIADWGCTMTCTAMVLNYYGVNTDPGLLNNWLNNNGGYVPSGNTEGELNWQQAVKYSNGKVSSVQLQAWKGNALNCQLLNNEINTGHPVIVQIAGSASYYPWHWVVVTGQSGNSYQINDPVSPNIKLLSVYNNTIYSLAVFSGNVPTLPDGVYQANNEDGVFLVSGGFRRAFLSADSFNHWGENWNSIQSVSESDLYGRTSWQPPIPDLITAPGKGINWIENGIARPISSSAIFNAMGFLWSDYRNVSLAEFNRYNAESVNDLDIAEPRLIVTDGPYVNKNTGYQSGGFRIRNLSQSSTPFDVTIRVYRSDGWWQDFPWQKSVVLGQNQEDVWWSNNSFPPGHYTFSVLYSYWANGINMQYAAPVAGVNPYTIQEGMFSLP